MVTRCDPAKDIIIIPGAFGHELNPVVKDNLAAKMYKYRLYVHELWLDQHTCAVH